MVIFESVDFGFEDLHDALLESGLSILRHENTLAVWLEDGPLLFITMLTGEAVQQESARIGIGTSYAEELTHCQTRIEIAFDDLEEVRTEVETLVEVQALLQEATQGFIFNTWNGKLAPPPDPDLK